MGNDSYYTLKLMGEIRQEQLLREAEAYRQSHRFRVDARPSVLNRVGILLVNVGESLQARSGVEPARLPQRAKPGVAGAR